MKLSLTTIFAAAFAGLLSAPASAQWPSYPTPNVPRKADGTPDFNAPAPRAADGHPDLSGLWEIYFNTIVASTTPPQGPPPAPGAEDVHGCLARTRSTVAEEAVAPAVRGATARDAAGMGLADADLGEHDPAESRAGTEASRDQPPAHHAASDREGARAVVAGGHLDVVTVFGDQRRDRVGTGEVAELPEAVGAPTDESASCHAAGVVRAEGERPSEYWMDAAVTRPDLGTAWEARNGRTQSIVRERSMPG